jgi:uncharacterized protein YdeI (YjbR/CyaY-like superfamily)
LGRILGAIGPNEVAGMKAKFFRTPADFRAWLEERHARSSELLVGFYKRESGKPSITWHESVGEALCFGWIDGVRRRVDEMSYTVRFTPRKPGSTWSTVNIERVKTLAAEGRMQPAGSRAYQARRSNKSGVYSYEQRPEQLVPPYAGMLARHPAAKKFFSAQAPSYRRAAIWWVISAKQEETRLRRAGTLIELSAQGKWIPQFLRKPSRR